MSEMMCPVVLEVTMSGKKNNRILFGLLGVLAVLIVILAAAIGVKVAEGRKNSRIDASRTVSNESTQLSAQEEQQKAADAEAEEAEKAADAEAEEAEKEAGTEGEGAEKAAGAESEEAKEAAGAESKETEKASTEAGDEKRGEKGQIAAADFPEDEELRRVLMAYQQYVDEHAAYFDGFLLAYLDEDEIPELIAIGDCEAAGQLIITYRDGELLENAVGRLGGLRYAKKQNFYYNSNGNMGYYYDEFYRLVDGEQTVIMAGRWGDKRGEDGRLVLNEDGTYPEQEYAWDGTVCSEEEYHEAIDQFIKQTVGDAELIKVDSYGDDSYDNIPEAYEGLKYRKYAAYWPRIHTFNLEDGVLTFSVGNGAHYGWGGEEIEYTVSYPVAEDCKWEQRGRGTGEHYQLEVADTDYIWDMSYERIKEWIETEKQEYDEAVATLGKDKARVESPFSVVVVVKEGVVVRVYTVIS